MWFKTTHEGVDVWVNTDQVIYVGPSSEKGFVTLELVNNTRLFIPKGEWESLTKKDFDKVKKDMGLEY